MMSGLRCVRAGIFRARLEGRLSCSLEGRNSSAVTRVAIEVGGDQALSLKQQIVIENVVAGLTLAQSIKEK